MSSSHYGLRTLTLKEIKRFWSVLGQTVTAPVITALLYLLVFAQVMQGRVAGVIEKDLSAPALAPGAAEIYPGVGYTQFLIPGLIMMSIIQNAFANTSSSMAQSKIMGNLVFVLISPLAPYEMFIAHLAASLLRARAQVDEPTDRDPPRGEFSPRRAGRARHQDGHPSSQAATASARGRCPSAGHCGGLRAARDLLPLASWRFPDREAGR